MRILLLLLLFISSVSFAQQTNFTCGVSDDNLPHETIEQLKNLPQIIAQNKLRAKAIDDFYICRVAVDIDFQTFSKYGGDTLIIKNEVANMIQKTSKIYEKEISTKLVLVNVNIWKEQSKDPYNNISDIFQLLDKLRNTYSSSALSRIQADVVMYLPSKGFTGAGGVASGKYNVSPWNGISTIAHEIGHNFGSPHTQSCNWPGGPIDYCYAAEGTCYTQALENINGTLMSYCGRRLNTFHPLCIDLMKASSAARYLKISKVSEEIVLPSTFSMNPLMLFQWKVVNYAEKYIVEISENEQFSGNSIKDTTQQAFYTLTKLKRNQDYFLRLLPMNRLGQGQWSNTMKISTPFNFLEVPQLKLPLNNAINIDGNSINFTFDAVSGATSYQFQYVSFSSGTTSYTFDAPSSTRTLSTNAVTLTLTAEAYAWRVRAMRGGEFSAWSEPFVFWTKPQSSSIDLINQAINGYPLSFPINYFGNNGNILQVTMKLFEENTQTKPVITKTWPLSIYANQSNYPFLLENLKPNTNYILRFEETNSDDNNIINIPTGLVRTIDKAFKTGSDSKSDLFNYFNNGNTETLSRTLKKAVFTDDFVFVSSNEGLVRMRYDGKDGRLYNRTNTVGKISNTLLDLKVDADGNLWMLSQISKRLAFDGVFPKPTYRFAKINPTTLQTIEESDFYGANNASFSSFDPNQKILNTGLFFHSIVRDSTKQLFQLPSNYTPQGLFQISKTHIWQTVNNSITRQTELMRYEINTGKITFYNLSNSLFSGSVNQIFVDDQSTLWIIQNLNTQLIKFSEANGFENIPNFNFSGNMRVVGASKGVLYFYNVSGINRDVYSFSEGIFKKIESIPHVNSNGSFEVDKQGNLWFWQADKLLKINVCGTIQKPNLAISKSTVNPSEEVKLVAEGCSNVFWTWKVDNQPLQSLVVQKNNSLTIKPENPATYQVKCIENGCSSEQSESKLINVVSMKVTALSSNKYCTNETIRLTPQIVGKFNQSNEFRAIFYNNTTRYGANLSINNQVAIPQNIVNGKYWVKIQSTDPIVFSSDSVEVTIFKAPSALISVPTEMYLFDSTQVNIIFTGTPPFKINLSGESMTSNTSTLSRQFVPIEPKNYSFTISNLSDANCSSGVISNREIFVNVTINPKVRNYWVQTFPNPVAETLNLHIYNKPGKELNYELYDLRGILVQKASLPIRTYLDKYSLDLSGYGAGTYFLKLNTGIRQEIRRIIKQ